MLKKTSIIALALLMFAIPAESRTGYFGVTIVRDGNDFAFPIFNSARNPRGVTQINHFLQLTELQSLGRSRSKAIFDQAKVNDRSIYGGKVSMVPQIYSNSRRIISIGFANSSCGATCTYWTKYDNFNPATGEHIALPDLFTSSGFELFSKTIAAYRAKKFRREVNKKVDAEYREGFLDTIGCFENDDLADFYIRASAIVIDGENCLVKSQKFERLDMIASFPLKTFRRHLNDYGRALFGLSRANLFEFRSDALPQLFYGSIGDSHRIAIVLTREFDHGVRGVYAYLRHGEGLGLVGTLSGSTVSLTEYVLSEDVKDDELGLSRPYIENGFIEASLNARELSGTWSNKDRTRNLPLAGSRNR